MEPGVEPGAGDAPGGALAGGDTQNLSSVVAGGMTWMIVGTIAAKVLTFGAQIVLGWKLDESDFALYAVATAIAGFMMVCRDVGIRELLIQRGREEYEASAGAGFWLAFYYNLLIAVLMCGVAMPLAIYMGHPVLGWMLAVMGISLPMGAVSAVLYARLRLELRFREFSRQMLIGNIARQGSSIGLALGGIGAMALAIPVFIGTLAEMISAYKVTGDKVWKRPHNVRQWPALLGRAKWLMFGSLATFALDYGFYLSAAPILGADSRVIGLFFFAYQVTAQIGVLLAVNSAQVLLPALVLMRSNPGRLAGAALRALKALMILGSFACMGLASIMSPLEHLIWRGNWADAVAPVVVLGVFFPWRISSGLCSAVLMATDRFKRYAYLTAVEAVALMIAAALAAWLHPTATGMALWLGGTIFVVRMAINIFVFRGMGVSMGALLMATVPAWLIAVGAGLMGFFADRWVPLEPMIRGAVPAPVPAWLIETIVSLARTFLAGSVCVALFGLTMRLLLPGQLIDAAMALPVRVRRLAMRAMLLKAPSAD